MTARIIPFPDLDADQCGRIIDRARMRPTDKIIAREAIINRNNLVDIAVLREVSMSRSGVGKRLKNYIIPELERVAAE